jgi:hypothetical protein
LVRVNGNKEETHGDCCNGAREALNIEEEGLEEDCALEDALRPERLVVCTTLVCIMKHVPAFAHYSREAPWHHSTLPGYPRLYRF